MALRVPAGCEYFSAQKSPPEIEANVRRLAYQFGETYSSYLVTEDGWESFWSPGRAGVVRFVRWCGYYALSVGGLLAPPEEQAKLLKCFKEFLKLNNISVMFMNVGRDQLAPFRAQGFEITKTGEEPFVPLESATWQGKDFEWIRRQENYCKKQGLE
jgi:phosphatidylglycerol lysyltransferase